MATIRPYRTYWDAVATTWCYFEAVSGTGIVHNGSTLIMGTDDTNPAAATWYSAIKFDSQTAPAWTTVGPIDPKGMAFLSILAQIARRTGGVGNFQFNPITDAWDSTASAADMRGLTTTGWLNATVGTNGYGIPVAWLVSSAPVPVYGFMVRITPGDATLGGVARIATNPAPVMRYLYQYSPTVAVRVDATERSTLTAAALSALASESEYDHFRIDTDILTSDVLSGQADTSLEPVDLADPGTLIRNMNWPESWQLDIPSAGALPVSLVSNPSLSGLRGMPLESELTLILKDGTEVSIGKQTQFVGDIVYHNNGTGEIELRSPLESILNALVASATPYSTTGTTNYAATLPLYIIADAMMNSGKLLYKRIHYNDIVYLLRRFCGVFSPLTFTAAELSDMTVADLIEQVGPLYGLALSQSGSGCIAFWHPSVYRPSLRVWTIDEDDCVADGYSLILRGRDEQFGYVRITDTEDTTGWSTQSLFYPYKGSRRNMRGVAECKYSTAATPQTTNVFNSTELLPGQGIPENPFSYTAQGQVFIDYGSARAALGRQMAQRLCSNSTECELTLGMKGLSIDTGDVIKLTGTGLSALTRFLVYSVQGNPSTGMVQVKGVHYPAVLALSNTFEDDGIKGEWRWMDETGATVATNTSQDGTDPDADTLTLATVSNEHWQGPMHSVGYAEWTTAPLLSATKHDIIDVCTMITPEFESDAGYFADVDYIPIMFWKKASGNQAMAVGIYRPGYSVSATSKSVTNQVFVAHIVDITATPFSFTAVAYSPAGVCGRESGTTAVPAAFALQWDNDGNVNVYIDRELVASGAGFSKADWTILRVTTTQYVKIGCVRHIQTDTAITELQRLQGLNGLDPYQP